MRINKLDNKITQTYTIKHCKANKNSSVQNNTTEQTRNIILPNNPLYYQAINNISFTSYLIAAPHTNKKNEIQSLKLYIPLEKGDSITLELTKEDSLELFIDEFGNLDSKALNFFTEKYLSFYEIRKANYEEERTMLLQILNDDSKGNVTAFNPEYDIQRALKKNTNTGQEIYAKSVLNDLVDPENKKIFASMYLNRIEKEFAKSVITTAKEALNVMKLYQLVNYQINEETIKNITTLAVLLQSYSENCEQDCFDEIYKNSVDDNGNFDLKYAIMLTNLVLHGGSYENQSDDIQQAKKLIEHTKIKNPYNLDSTIEDIVTKFQDGECNLYNII